MEGWKCMSPLSKYEELMEKGEKLLNDYSTSHGNTGVSVRVISYFIGAFVALAEYYVKDIVDEEKGERCKIKND